MERWVDKTYKMHTIFTFDHKETWQEGQSVVLMFTTKTQVRHGFYSIMTLCLSLECVHYSCLFNHRLYDWITKTWKKIVANNNKSVMRLPVGSISFPITRTLGSQSEWEAGCVVSNKEFLATRVSKLGRNRFHARNTCIHWYEEQSDWKTKKTSSTENVVHTWHEVSFEGVWKEREKVALDPHTSLPLFSSHFLHTKRLN